MGLTIKIEIELEDIQPNEARSLVHSIEQSNVEAKKFEIRVYEFSPDELWEPTDLSES